MVWVFHGALFSVGVEVCECHCVYDGLLGVLLSCIVGWGMIAGLTGVMFVVLESRGVVTGGVARALHLEQVRVFWYCLVLASVAQVVWTQSLQEMHRTELLYFLLLVMRWEQTVHVNFWWSRVAPKVSGECNEEEYDCRHVIRP